VLSVFQYFSIPLFQFSYPTVPVSDFASETRHLKPKHRFFPHAAQITGYRTGEATNISLFQFTHSIIPLFHNSSFFTRL